MHSTHTIGMPGTLHKVKYIFHSCHFTVASISYNKTFMIAETAYFVSVINSDNSKAYG